MSFFLRSKKPMSRRLAVIPGEPIADYLRVGHDPDRLRGYYNPGGFFDEVFLLSPLEEDRDDLLGMRVYKTRDRQLRGAIKRLGIDVVRAYGGYWPCAMACDYKRRGVPVVVSVHDTNPDLLFPAIRKADYVWCVSSVVRDQVLGLFPHPDRVWLLPNRVCLDTMRPYAGPLTDPLLRRYPFRYRIVHVGRKVSQKNLDTVIRALSLLGDDYGLIAIGRGEVESYRSLAEDLGVGQRCFFLEAVENRDLPAYYSLPGCFCVPSRWEGFGVVFIEAMACGAVVVTSDIAPMNEFIRHQDNGLLVRDYERPGALAEMIRSACEQEDLRERIQQRAPDSVRPFARQRVDALEAEYYRRVLDHRC